MPTFAPEQIAGGEPEEAQEAKNREPLFPLAVEELTASMKLQGRELLHRFDPIRFEDWAEFERMNYVVSESDDKEVTAEDFTVEAVEWLWGKAIRAIEGYGEQLPTDWRERLPIQHKEAAIGLLAQVAVDEDAEPHFFGADRVVVLEAARNGVVHKGLRHCFLHPKTSDVKAARRALLRESAVRVGGVRGSGGSRKSQSVVRSSLERIAAVYDELIVRVEGYESGDGPLDLVGDASKVARLMDPLHKKTALRALVGNG